MKRWQPFMHPIQLTPCKTWRGRVNRAIALLKAGWAGHCRAFDDCFEMGDGRAVFAAIQARRETDRELRVAFDGFFGDRLLRLFPERRAFLGRHGL